jgi:hypothetical protein
MAISQAEELPRPPDPCRFAHIERLNQQRGELVRQREELAERLGGAQGALADARRRQEGAAAALADRERSLPGAPPSSLKAAAKQLAAARKQAEAAAGAEPEEGLEARYGGPKHPLTASVDRILQSGARGCKQGAAGWRGATRMRRLPCCDVVAAAHAVVGGRAACKAACQEAGG